MSERYAMFKNYMNNELGITKKDIEDWTKESVRQVAENYVEKRMTPNIITNAMSKSFDFNRNIKRLISDHIMEKINISIGE